MKLDSSILMALIFLASYKEVAARTLERDTSLDSCESTAAVTTTVYMGWPHTISCDVFVTDVEDSIYMIYDNYDSFDFDSEVQCLIFDADKNLLSNETTLFDDLTSNFGVSGLQLPDVSQDNTEFELYVFLPDVGNCIQKRVHLNLIAFETETCKQFLHRQNNFLVPSSIGRPRSLACENNQQIPRIYATTQSANTSFTWQRNCTGQLPNNLEVASNNNLDFPSLEYDHAGVYVCSVTHNGMTRYVTSYDICVQQPHSRIQPILTCMQNDYYSSTGNNVTIMCEANLGRGYLSSSNFRILAGKANQTRKICRADSMFGSSAGRITCSITEEKEKCFLYVPSLAERVLTPYIIPVQLSIKNIHPNDFGVYNVKVLTIFGDSVVTQVNLVENV